MTHDTLSFTIDRTKSNPKFESYKLHAVDDSTVSRRPFSQSYTPIHTLDEDATLGFRDARARSRWNHLSPGPDGSLVWVDASGSVWWTQLTVNDSTIHKVLELAPPTREYPTAIPLGDDLWIITSGRARLHLIRIGQGSATLLALTSLDQPFKMYSIDRIGPQTAVGLLTFKNNTLDSRTYEVITVTISWSSDLTSIDCQSQSSVSGNDFPAFAHWDSDGSRWLVASSCPYFDTLLPKITDDVEVKSQSMVDAETVAKQPTPEVVKAPPCYTWTQTLESVSISIYLPAIITARTISVTFSPTSFKLIIQCPSILGLGDETILDAVIERFSHSAKLWGSLSSSDCTWTWDNSMDNDTTCKKDGGILTVELEKCRGEEGGRWPNVFEVDDGVLESLDPSDRINMMERMEKYTNDLMNNSAPEQINNGHSVSSLTSGEVDVEVDEEVSGGARGEGLVLTWITNQVNQSSNDSTTKVVSPHPNLPVTITSRPLDTFPPLPFSLVTSQNIDGLLFSPPPSSSETVWQHDCTFPALAFVVASKRDARFIRHLHHSMAIVVESRNPIQSGAAKRGEVGNMYLYHKTELSRGLYAKQQVIKLSQGGSGSVMGIAGVVVNGKMKIAILCENELVVVDNDICI